MRSRIPSLGFPSPLYPNKPTDRGRLAFFTSRLTQIRLRCKFSPTRTVSNSMGRLPGVPVRRVPSRFEHPFHERPVVKLYVALDARSLPRQELGADICETVSLPGESSDTVDSSGRVELTNHGEVVAGEGLESSLSKCGCGAALMESCLGTLKTELELDEYEDAVGSIGLPQK